VNVDFEPIVLAGADEGEIQIVAEFLEVLAGSVEGPTTPLLEET
jgi:hypothetical protein